MTLYVELTGDPQSRPPLVLIHGFGGFASVWNAVRRFLPGEVPVIAYDLPGHRHSLNAEGRGGAGKMAKAILADLEARGLTHFHLAGHSMGGAVASLIAMRAVGKVKSLSLFAPGGMGPEINADALEHFADAGDREAICTALPVMASTGFVMPDGVMDEMVAARAMPGAIESLREIYAAMFTEQTSPVRAQGVLPIELFEQLTCKVAVMWGEDDAILPFHQMDRLPERFNKVPLKGVGHMLLDECPEAVASLLGAVVR